MTQIVAIPASLRSSSKNLKLLEAARELAPDDVDIRIERLVGIPPYDGDVEQRDGIPDRVAELKDLVAAADGLLISSPEYNRGIPGVAKNAIDWMSRPPDDRDRVFAGHPVAVISGAGGSGGRVTQERWISTFNYLKMRIFTERELFVPRVWTAFDDAGNLTGDVAERLESLIEAFARFCAGES